MIIFKNLTLKHFRHILLLSKKIINFNYFKSMSKFILKITNDGICHLYFDDPSKEGFLKVGQANQAKFVRDSNPLYVVLSNDNEATKTLFGIIDNKVFQVTMPKNSKISFIDWTCVYERNKLTYTMVLKQGVFEETLLGKRMWNTLSFPSNMEYGKLEWTYFVKEVGNEVELSHFLGGKIVKLGKYASVKSNSNAKIFGVYADGLIDVFNPNSTEPEKGKPFVSYCDGKGIFVPYDNTTKWVFYPGYCLLGKNAAYELKKVSNARVISLYRITGNKLDLIKVSQNFQFKSTPYCLLIDDMYYKINLNDNLVDLDNPVPTFKKKITDFFKKL